MPTAFFGAPWGRADGSELRVSTPVGQACLWCDEAIILGEQGMIQTAVRAVGGQLVAEARPIHRECGLRSVVGGLAHIERRCSCYGGDEDEDARLSKREEALLVWDRVTHPSVR